jgi:predicted amidohydrolase YtcJ
MKTPIVADTIFHNGRITTLDPGHPEAANLAIKDGRIIGVDDAEEYQQEPNTKVIDLKGRRVIPGLNDSHLHVIRGGLNYNMELRWDGVPSLADALRMLKEQAQRTPAGQWVRVVGGWTEFQFAERRMPTLEEINAAAPTTPVFILHLYCRALLNQAALRACGYTKDTPNPPGGEIQHDHAGNPTGLLIARPNATILYATLAKGPKLPPEHQLNSTRHFMRELNRLGLTSIIDAGGGFQNYPEDYAVIEDLHRRGEMTVRIAYNLFTQKPKQEKEDFARWIKMTGPGKGDDFFRCNGGGEITVSLGRKRCGSTRKAAVGFPARAEKKARWLWGNWPISWRSRMIIFPCPKIKSKELNPYLPWWTAGSFMQPMNSLRRRPRPCPCCPNGRP